MNTIFFSEIDTGNYTNPLVICHPESSTVCQSKKLLPVMQGELGLRHGDALFHHVKNIGDRITYIMSAMVGKLVAMCMLDKPENTNNLNMQLRAGGVSWAVQ